MDTSAIRARIGLAGLYAQDSYAEVYGGPKAEFKVTAPCIKPGFRYEILIAIKDADGNTVSSGTRSLQGKSATPYTTTVKVK
jgi:hypothetical protein